MGQWMTIIGIVFVIYLIQKLQIDIGGFVGGIMETFNEVKGQFADGG